MSSPEGPCEEVRREMIEALENGKWDFTERAYREGPEAFRRHSENPSHEELIDYILDLLEDGFPLKPVDLHDPPYGGACEMENTDGRGLYIKLKFVWPYVLVMSFHDSTRPPR